MISNIAFSLFGFSFGFEFNWMVFAIMGLTSALFMTFQREVVCKTIVLTLSSNRNAFIACVVSVIWSIISLAIFVMWVPESLAITVVFLPLFKRNIRASHAALIEAQIILEAKMAAKEVQAA